MHLQIIRLIKEVEGVIDAESLKARFTTDRQAWDTLVSVLDAHPDESLHDPASPLWTSRDVYAHLARWINYSSAVIEAYCAGRKLPEQPEGTIDETNSRWQQEDTALSVNEAREKARAAFAHRLNVIQAIPADRWDDNIERMVSYDGWEHFDTHRGYIVVGRKRTP